MNIVTNYLSEKNLILFMIFLLNVNIFALISEFIDSLWPFNLI